jgi:signal transduction histidine kinase
MDIDTSLTRMKSNDNSRYYDLLDQYLAGYIEEKKVIPLWLVLLLAGIFSLLVFSIYLLIRLRSKEQVLRNNLKLVKETRKHLIETEKQTSLAVFTAGIAHEINNPINYIINSMEGYKEDLADLVRLLTFFDDAEENCPGPIRERLNELKDLIDYPAVLDEMAALHNGIYTGAQKIHDIVTSLKIFHNPDRAPLDNVSVDEEIRRAVLIIKAQPGQDIEIITRIDDIPPVRLRPGELSQVILQIVMNSLDAINIKSVKNQKEEIRIEAGLDKSAAKNDLVITVSDTGCGMDPQIIKKIFHPFYTTKEAGSGTGLGLSTCNQIIRNLGGKITVSSQKGQGTVITITLPV